MEYLILVAIILAVPAGLIYAIVQLSSLRGRIERLEYQIDSLQRDENGSARPSEEPAPLRSPDIALHEPIVARPTPPPPPPQATASNVTLSPRQLQPEPKPHVSTKSELEWEALVGGKLLNRIGALAIIIGVGFFLKYAFDKNWISPWVRVLMGVVGGGGMLYFGKVMHDRKYAIFSQGVIGAGVAVLYLSVYAAFDFYHLISQPAAFPAMSAITAIAVWRGVRHDSAAIAALGWLGGFLTPYLLRTEVVNHVGFLVYVGLLAAGVRVISLWRPNWSFLGILAFAGAALHFWGWFAEYYSTDKAVIAAIAVLWLWGMFVAAEPVAAARQRPQDRVPNHILMAVQAGVWLLALYLALHGSFKYEAGGIFGGMAVVYAGIGYALNRQPSKNTILTEQYFVQAVAFLAAAIAVVWSDYQQVIALAGEAALMSWIAQRRKVPVFRYAIFGLLTLTFFRVLLIEHTLIFEPILSYRLIINERSLALVSLTAALALGARWLHDEKSGEEPWIRQSLSSGFCLSLFLLFTVETLDYFRWLAATDQQYPLATAPELTSHLTLTLAWAVLGAALVTLGSRSGAKLLLVAGFFVAELALLAALIVAWSYSPVDAFIPIFNFRAMTLLLIMASLYWSLRLLSHTTMRDESLASMAQAVRASLFVMGLFFLTVETWDIFDKSRQLAFDSGDEMSGRIRSIANMQHLALSGVWLIYSVVMMTVGIWKHKRPLRLAALALFGITILKIFLWDLTFLSGVYRILSFIGLGAILLAVSFAYQRFKSVIIGESPKEGCATDD